MRTKYHLNGKEINLTSEDIIIKSNNFNVDKSGNLTCNNAQMNDATMNNVTIQGGKIVLDNVPSDSEEYFIVKSSNGDKFAASGSRMWLNRGTGGSAIYFQGGYLSQAAITLNDQDGSRTEIYGNGISTPKLTQTSLESEKKNFVKFNNALDIIKQVDIYKYNLKDEKDTDKKHIGFVIGENYNYSKELTSKENNGADIYSLASCCLQAIKEQQIEIEKLKNKIKEMEVK